MFLFGLLLSGEDDDDDDLTGLPPMCNIASWWS